MKSNKAVGFGVFLITIGIIWVLVTTGVISWSIFNALIVLWPLILVLIGVNIIFRSNEIIKAAAWILFLAVLVSYGYFYGGGRIKHEGMTEAKNVSIEKIADIQKGKLKIKLGGTSLTLDSDTSKLLEAEIRDPEVIYSENTQNGISEITFSKKVYNITSFNTEVNSRINKFHLNNQITWDIDMDTGAVDGDFDLTGLVVDKIKLDTGAANMNIKLGGKSQHQDIEINAGASKIEFTVPSNAGIRVKMDGALNSTNLDGPDWEKKNGYNYSKGYDQAEVKIDMDVDMGVGRFTVNFKQQS